jgi:hypothetical protein
MELRRELSPRNEKMAALQEAIAAAGSMAGKKSAADEISRRDSVRESRDEKKPAGAKH